MLGPIISGIGSIVGGILGEQGKQRELDQQREFAKEGVRWRVEDARKAGIHPAVALGASVPSYSPVGLGGSIAEGLSGSSQDISRAIEATRTLPERVDAYTARTQALTLDRMGLENELLRRQIAQVGPAFPMAGNDNAMPGQGDSGVVMPSPFGLPGLDVANPKMAQKAQDHFGEGFEWIYGGANFVDSLARAAWAAGVESGRKAGESYSRLPTRGRGPGWVP